MNVVSLQESRLGAVYVTRMEAIYPALIGRVFISKFLIDAHQFFQLVALNIDIDVYEAGLELFHLK